METLSWIFATGDYARLHLAIVLILVSGANSARRTSKIMVNSRRDMSYIEISHLDDTRTGDRIPLLASVKEYPSHEWLTTCEMLRPSRSTRTET